jgi:hypothetical protein
VSNARKYRRRLARHDGQTVRGGCPNCDAELVVGSGDPAYNQVRHDLDCPVLLGDLTARQESNIASALILATLSGADRVGIVGPRGGGRR